jgi:hypothetical protein
VTIAWAHQISKYGPFYMLHSARDEPTAARASGVDIWRVRTIAFALSGTIVGLGDAMHTGFLGVVTVDVHHKTSPPVIAISTSRGVSRQRAMSINSPTSLGSPMRPAGDIPYRFAVNASNVMPCALAMS